MTIAREHIADYMGRTAQQLTPPNNWWHYRQSCREGTCLFLMLGLAVLTFYGASTYLQLNWLWWITGILCAAMVVMMFLAGSREIPPGEWNFYTLHQCYQRFPDFYQHLSSVVEEVRIQQPMAEFEIGVLEQERQYVGGVLFQLIDARPVPALERTDAGSPDIYFKEPIALKVFSLSGEPVPDAEWLYERRLGLA